MTADGRGALEAELASFVTSTRWESLPEPVRTRATEYLLDALACALTGRDAPSRGDFAGAVRALTGGGTHPVVGDAPASMAGAALLNAWQTTATTMCDVYRPAMCHVTPVVLAATLAAAHESQPSLDRFLGAFALGLEVTVRLCAAMQTELYRGPRWHAPGVIGPYGAATAAGLLAGLDSATLRSAWGAAGLQSAGTFAAIGSPGVKLTQARAAMAGVLAVEMARRGNGGAPDPLTHPNGGLFDAYAGRDPGRVVEALGERWDLLDLALRRWPAASSLQSAIEAVLALRQEDTPESLHLELPPLSFELCAAMPWDDQLTALQSARWVAAVVWADGECWTDQFAPARIADPATGAVARERVTVSEDASLAQGACRVTARSATGERTLEVGSPLGSPDRPLTAADISAKLERAAGPDRARDIAASLTAPEGWSFRAFADHLTAG